METSIVYTLFEFENQIKHLLLVIIFCHIYCRSRMASIMILLITSRDIFLRFGPEHRALLSSDRRFSSESTKNAAKSLFYKHPLFFALSSQSRFRDFSFTCTLSISSDVLTWQVTVGGGVGSRLSHLECVTGSALQDGAAHFWLGKDESCLWYCLGNEIYSMLGPPVRLISIRLVPVAIFYGYVQLKRNTSR